MQSRQSYLAAMGGTEPADEGYDEAMETPGLGRGLVRGYLRNPIPGDATQIFRSIASGFRHFWSSQNERQFCGKSLHEYIFWISHGYLGHLGC